VNAPVRIRPAIRFRGRSFLALSLAPVAPLDAWFEELDRLAIRSPGFFGGRPVVLDVAGLGGGREEIVGLLVDLASRNIRVMAIEGAAPDTLDASLPPPISGGRDARPIEAEPDRTVEAVPTPALLLDQPVRSGQSILYPQGDVIVIGPVSSGAEIIAGGSIHVYGALRGRAIAGTMGQASARIFCRKLEAELLAIDGLYATADSMDQSLIGRPVQAWLNGDTMMMATMI
jgi:septum site-determining protein MinC